MNSVRNLVPLFACVVCCAAATACGAPPDELVHNNHQGPAGDGGVGAPCSSDPHCLLELVCVAEMPSGMCSRTCDVDNPCPDGSNCIRVRVDDRTYNMCLPACRYDAMCRQEDGYYCLLLESGVRVCWF